MLEITNIIKRLKERNKELLARIEKLEKQSQKLEKESKKSNLELKIGVILVGLITLIAMNKKKNKTHEN